MGKKKEPDSYIVKIFVADIWSALTRVVAAARWKDLAAIGEKEGKYYVIHSNEMSVDAINELQNFNTLLIIARGKTSKCVLSADERQFLAEQIRSSNAWLN